QPAVRAGAVRSCLCAVRSWFAPLRAADVVGGHAAPGPAAAAAGHLPVVDGADVAVGRVRLRAGAVGGLVPNGCHGGGAGGLRVAAGAHAQPGRRAGDEAAVPAPPRSLRAGSGAGVRDAPLRQLIGSWTGP